LFASQIKKGDHRVHAAVYHGDHSCTSYTVTLKKGLRNRLGEELISSQLILRSIAGAAKFSLDRLPIDLCPELAPESGLEVIQIASHSSSNDVFHRLYKGIITHAMFVHKQRAQFHESNGQHSSPAPNLVYVEEIQFPDDCIVYSGSFNPLHEGHIQLVLAALRTRGWSPDQAADRPNPPIVFEITPFNADKAAIEHTELERRLHQFDPRNSLFLGSNITNVAVCISTKSLFVEKSDIFRNCAFLVGTDTMIRLIEPKWYAPLDQLASASLEQKSLMATNNMIMALAKMFTRGCSFIVGGRLNKKSCKFETLSEIWKQSSVIEVLPGEVISMFGEIPEFDFRVDLSSTEIRNRQSGSV
jgi:hypothetical protein